METYYLLLYVGADYLIPIIDSSQGDMYRYSKDGDMRFWLYFREDCDTTKLLYGRDNYHASHIGKPGYWGDFWTRVDRGDEAVIHGVRTPYVEMLQISGMLEQLQDWFYAVMHRVAAEPIPTICLFDDGIGHAARKRFLQLLASNRFLIQSFSVAFDSLLGAYCANPGGLSLDEGDGSCLIHVGASGNSVRLSAMLDRNGEFVVCRESYQFGFDGENPVKMALVKHIVDEDNREHNFFTPEQCESEYRYQMQYVDQWLELAKKTENNESFLVTYHLSIDPEISYHRSIEKSFITRKQREYTRPISNAIEQYCNASGGDRVSQYLFTGELFASEEFFSLVTAPYRHKARYIGGSHYPEILHLYMRCYPSLKEDLSDYDVIVARRSRGQASARAWYEIAGRISVLLERLSYQKSELERAASSFFRQMELSMAQSDEFLKNSRFDDAERCLEAPQKEYQSLKEYIQTEVRGLLFEHQQNSDAYERVSEYAVSQDMIGRVQGVVSELETMILLVKQGEEARVAELEQINSLRRSYPEYLVLRHRFDTAQTLLEKSQLLEQMRPLTRESLPEDPCEIPSVEGTITADVEMRKSLLGLKTTASRLTIRVAITSGASFPYHCVLVVSDAPAITQIDRSKLCFDLPKGTPGPIEETVELPVAQFPKAERVVIRLLVDTTREQMADTSKICFNPCYVKLK